MPDTFNIAAALTDMAARAPYQPGVVFPAGRDQHGARSRRSLPFSSSTSSVTSMLMA